LFVSSPVTAQVVNWRVSLTFSDWIPIDELIRGDGDSAIVSLSANGVTFKDAMDDDWYRATTFCSNATAGSEAMKGYIVPVYRANEAAAPLWCLDQFQFCIVNSSSCGPMASLSDALADTMALPSMRGYNPISRIRSRSFWTMLENLHKAYGYIADVVASAGSSSLVSKRTLQSGVHRSLPRNQWQVDVTRWFATMLAINQALFVETAVGSGERDSYRIPPTSKAQRELCFNQVLEYMPVLRSIGMQTNQTPRKSGQTSTHLSASSRFSSPISWVLSL
jgi:hypothetical protein